MSPAPAGAPPGPPRDAASDEALEAARRFVESIYGNARMRSVIRDLALRFDAFAEVRRARAPASEKAMSDESLLAQVERAIRENVGSPPHPHGDVHAAAVACVAILSPLNRGLGARAPAAAEPARDERAAFEEWWVTGADTTGLRVEPDFEVVAKAWAWESWRAARASAPRPDAREATRYDEAVRLLRNAVEGIDAALRSVPRGRSVDAKAAAKEQEYLAVQARDEAREWLASGAATGPAR